MGDMSRESPTKAEEATNFGGGAVLLENRKYFGFQELEHFDQRAISRLHWASETI
jgi:hypothetical protein